MFEFVQSKMADFFFHLECFFLLLLKEAKRSFGFDKKITSHFLLYFYAGTRILVSVRRNGRTKTKVPGNASKPCKCFRESSNGANGG